MKDSYFLLPPDQIVRGLILFTFSGVYDTLADVQRQ